MSIKIENFFKRHSILPENIKYVLREEGKTAVHLLDGRIVSTYNTVKEIKGTLPQDDFLNPNKGILLAVSQIADVSDGAYKMVDGRSFKYRVHNSTKHDSRMLMLGQRLGQTQSVADHLDPSSFGARFFALDEIPLPSCVIEVIYDKYGHSTEYIIRYANQAMSEFEQMPRDDIIDHHYHEVFDNRDPRRLVVYSDVALNGTKRLIHYYNDSKGMECDLLCYQPIEGYCTCIMLLPVHTLNTVQQ